MSFYVIWHSWVFHDMDDWCLRCNFSCKTNKCQGLMVSHVKPRHIWWRANYYIHPLTWFPLHLNHREPNTNGGVCLFVFMLAHVLLKANNWPDKLFCERMNGFPIWMWCKIEKSIWWKYPVNRDSIERTVWTQSEWDICDIKCLTLEHSKYIAMFSMQTYCNMHLRWSSVSKG